MTAHAFVSLWDEAEGDTFKADPPNAVLTWLDGDKVHEAEVVITDASVLAHGRAISYEVMLEAGQALNGQVRVVSMFIDAYDSSLNQLNDCSYGKSFWPCLKGDTR